MKETQWAKSPRKQSVCRSTFFVNSALKIQCHIGAILSKKYTSTDCYLGDFAHWDK